MRFYELLLCGGLLSVVAISCGDEKTPLAPEVKGSALASSAPKSAAAKKFSIASFDSKVKFSMEAAEEKIRGRATGVEGTLFIDVKDLTQTTGNIAVDLETLELYQKKKTETGDWGDEVLEPTQNKHARSWLEIDDSAPGPMRAKNRRVEFRIDKVEAASEKDITKLAGDERKVTLKAKGEFLLHQRTSQKTVDLEISFTFSGGNPTAVTIKTVSPLEVGLAEHDVRPRESFGKFAKATLDTLGSKVAKNAQVELELKLVPGDPPAAPTAVASTAPTAEPEASASASADASASASADASASAAPSSSAAASGAPAVSASASAAPKASASAKK